MQIKSAITTLSVILSLSTVCADAARSQGFPSRPIRLVVPYPPGGASDVTARILAERMSGILGQPVVVENKPGASGQVGLELGARSAPDGYTIIYTASSAALLPSTNKSLSIDLKTAVQPIAQCCVAPLVLAVPASLPVQNADGACRLFQGQRGQDQFRLVGLVRHADGKQLWKKCRRQFRARPLQRRRACVAGGSLGRRPFPVSSDSARSRRWPAPERSGFWPSPALSASRR